MARSACYDCSVESFSRTILESLTHGDRRERLAALAQALTHRLAEHSQWNEYWREVDAVIAELRALGHDLWSHDYDGERRHLWGWDYMHPKTAGYLQIQFDFEGPVMTFWRGEDAALGVIGDE